MSTPPKSVDLRPDHWAIVRDALRQHVPDREALVFGSRATGNAKAYSDLDLAIMGEEPLSLRIVSALDEALSESDLPFKVDVVECARIDEGFRRIIRGHGVVVWGVGGDSRVVRPACFENWSTMPFTEAFLINPAVPIERGSRTPFVNMAAIEPGRRTVHSSSVRTFRGSGSRFQNGDTLFARITPCLENGKIACYNADVDLGIGHGSTEFIVIRGRPGVTDTKYAFYVARSDLVRGYAIGQMTGTSGRQRVPPGSLAHLDVAVPSLPEQRAIAHILGSLDDKIELNRRTNETLEAMARALFKSWFVDFDPVRAKMEGRDTGLPEDIADLFPGRLVDSEMGEIPAGWEVARLSQLMDINPKRSLPRGQEAPYLPMANMPTRAHVPDSIAVRAFGSGMRFANGDTLVARITPCLENGKTAYVDFLRDNEVGWGSTEYIVLKPQPPLPDQFAYCLARSGGFREFAIHNMSGTSGRQRVPVAAVKGFLLVAPPAGLAAHFGNVAALLFERANRASRASRTLAAIRDTLLPALISGDLRAQAVEQFTGGGVG